MIVNHVNDHWTFDEESGATALNSTGGTNGTITGGVTLNQVGKIGRAYDFNGVNGEVTALGYKGVTDTKARTVSMWIKTASGAVRGLISWGKEETGDAWDFVLDSPYIRLNLNGGYRLGSTNVADGAWHHVVALFAGDDGSPDAVDVKLYVDGEPESASGLDQALHTENLLDVAIGNNRHRNAYFPGHIDDVAIWNSGLVAGEVRSRQEQ